MTIGQEPPRDGQTIKQEKRGTGLEDLFKLAQEVGAREPTAEEKIKEQTEALKAKEQEKGREKEQFETGVAFALKSGRLHYLELTDEATYNAQMRQAFEAVYGKDGNIAGRAIVRDPVWLKQHENDPKSDFDLYEAYRNRISDGRIMDKLPGLTNTLNGVKNVWVKKPDEYLPVLQEAYRYDIARLAGNNEYEWDNANDTERYFVMTGKIETNLVGTVMTDRQLTPEEKSELELNWPRFIETREEMTNLALRKHAEGFGTAALEVGDIAVAVDNLDAAGILENPEIIVLLKTEMTALKVSSSPEDQLKLRKASGKLLAIQTRKAGEQTK